MAGASATTVVGSAVCALLVLAGVMAGLGGMFTSSVQRASASPVARPASPAAARIEMGPKPPPGSGQGRRVIFDQSQQRVWLVASDDTVDRSYLVTGSKAGNLRPGSYTVKSRTRVASAAIGRGRLEYFVRFAQGRHAPIGFHAITVNRYGKLVYSREQLGVPHTPGCVEEWRDDAAALWDFAPVGTPVVVTA